MPHVSSYGRYREYAEAIWEIEELDIPVIQARVADWLGVSRASVNEMVHRMKDDGLVTIDDEIRLTDEGRHLAAVIVRRHRLAEQLQLALDQLKHGVTPDQEKIRSIREQVKQTPAAQWLRAKRVRST